MKGVLGVTVPASPHDVQVDELNAALDANCDMAGLCDKTVQSSYSGGPTSRLSHWQPSLLTPATSVAMHLGAHLPLPKCSDL